MSEAPEAFYTPERWHNWIDRIRDADLDPEDEDAARLLINLQDDTAIAVAKIVTAVDDAELTAEEGLDELATVRNTVLGEIDLEDEEKRLLVDGVRTSLVCVFAAAEEYVMNGPADGTVEEHVRDAADAEADGDEETALDLCSRAGTLVIDGDEVDLTLAEDIEYGAVVEWINGLDSLERALDEPEVIDEE